MSASSQFVCELRNRLQAHVGDIMCVSSKPAASVAPQAPEEGTRVEEQHHACPPCTKVIIPASCSLDAKPVHNKR